MKENGDSDDLILEEKYKALSKYVCPAYKNITYAEKNLINTLHFKGTPLDLSKEYFNNMCY